ncbi:MAG: high frequency lysogenization protein HflD [Xanthomonadales bacterium]|nr:high frequency lysogenization protein HflD [Xanthomonadales bacterium]
MSDRTLALSGLFQATELVRQAANHGTWSGFAARASLDSLFCVQSQSVEDIYGGAERLHLGLETLVLVLRGENDNLDALRYAIGLLQIERKFRRKRGMQARVGDELERIAGEYGELEEHERQDRQADEVSRLYTETISAMQPRIVVQGKPQYLQSERTVNWIRTLLFAGLRSAVLWNQLGGSRWKLMFGRKQMLAEAEGLLG